MNLFRCKSKALVASFLDHVQRDKTRLMVGAVSAAVYKPAASRRKSPKMSVLAGVDLTAALWRDNLTIKVAYQAGVSEAATRSEVAGFTRSPTNGISIPIISSLYLKCMV